MRGSVLSFNDKHIQPKLNKNSSRCQFHQHFCARVFCTNVVLAAFLVTCTVEKDAEMTFVRKICMFTIDEIDSRVLVLKLIFLFNFKKKQVFLIALDNTFMINMSAKTESANKSDK